ncbi:hypothetical protein ACWG8W_06195 [Citricoccus zhacaiensis]
MKPELISLFIAVAAKAIAMDLADRAAVIELERASAQMGEVMERVELCAASVG